MTFEKGIPTSVNGKKMKYSDIVRELNRLGGKHGIGIIDIVENRVVGMKSRGVYETPGGTILMEAHQQLEELILDRDTYADWHLRFHVHRLFGLLRLLVNRWSLRLWNL